MFRRRRLVWVGFVGRGRGGLLGTCWFHGRIGGIEDWRKERRDV